MLRDGLEQLLPFGDECLAPRSVDDPARSHRLAASSGFITQFIGRCLQIHSDNFRRASEFTPFTDSQLQQILIELSPVQLKTGQPRQINAAHFAHLGERPLVLVGEPVAQTVFR